MQQVNMRVSYFIVGLLILLNPIFASTIGATIDKTYDEINKGEVSKFKISVFTLENTTLNIEVSSSKIEDLQIDIVPKKFKLSGEITSNPSGNYEWVILDGNKYVKVHNIYIYIRPKEITQNYYSIPITISAFKKSNKINEGIVQNVVQSLQYTLHVYIHGEIIRKEEFVNLTTPFYNLSNFPAYQLPTIKPTNIYNSQPTKPQTETKEETQKINIPTGFFSLPEDEENINWITIFTIIIVVLLAIYLIKR